MSVFSLLYRPTSRVSLFGDVGAVVIIPELRRLTASKVCENGDSEDSRLGDAKPESEGGRTGVLLFGASARLDALERKNPKGDSDEELEWEVAAEFRPEPIPFFSFSSCERPFLALCSPTSSLSGSVQITSHMVKWPLAGRQNGKMGLQDRLYTSELVRRRYCFLVGRLAGKERGLLVPQQEMSLYVVRGRDSQSPR